MFRIPHIVQQNVPDRHRLLACLRAEESQRQEGEGEEQECGEVGRLGSGDCERQWEGRSAGVEGRDRPWKPYLGVIREKCSQALNILDRFHIVAKVNKALDEVRSAEARRMKGDGYEPVLTKSRWCLLKRPENLTAKQKLKLKDLVRYNLQSVRAYLLKEDFQQLWNYQSTAWAAKFLDEWCRCVMRSRIQPMKKVVKTLRAHRELLLNYFRARKEFSSGVIEGLNNKAKVTMRKSYGFRTFRVTELALYHSLGKLPEPELTHRFPRRAE